MIFVTLGTQKFQFDRLLADIDNLIDEGIISDNVFAQRGYSKYTPKNYKYVDFLSQTDFNKYLNDCDFLITHGGVGSIMNGLKAGKKVIICPRLKKYGEHIDDHQTEIATKYAQLGYCLSVSEANTLKDCIEKVQEFESHYLPDKQSGKDNKLLDAIFSFLEKN